MFFLLIRWFMVIRNISRIDHHAPDAAQKTSEFLRAQVFSREGTGHGWRGKRWGEAFLQNAFWLSPKCVGARPNLINEMDGAQEKFPEI
jgi:hypothetical protein